MGRTFIRNNNRNANMTYSSLFDDIDKPKRKRRKRKTPKQSVLWTVYHTVLAVELLIIIIIEGIELLR